MSPLRLLLNALPLGVLTVLAVAVASAFTEPLTVGWWFWLFVMAVIFDLVFVAAVQFVYDQMQQRGET